MKIIVISGFARSGKTTLANGLANLGIPTASSSEVLDIETLNHYGIPATPYNVAVLQRKKERQFRKLMIDAHPNKIDLEDTYLKVVASTNTKGVAIRDFKIHVAEDVIVPQHTREFFAKKCLASLEPHAATNKIGVIFSTIQSEREFIYSEVLWSKFTTDLISCNILSDKQVTNVDSRSLIESPDLTLVNELDGSDKLTQRFLKLIKNFEPRLIDTLSNVF